MKTYIAIIRDHSASMRSLSKGAINDYNLTIEGIKNSINRNDDGTVSVIECGVGYMAEVRIKQKHESILSLQPLISYTADGNGTPLFDSVGKGIEVLEEIRKNNERRKEETDLKEYARLKAKYETNK